MTDLPTKTPPAKQGESWGELGKTIIYAFAIAVVIRTFLFQPFNIPSASMEATLLVGDYLFVEKFSYGYSKYTFPFGSDMFGQTERGRVPNITPSRGDVIVFKMPNKDSPDYEKDFIKRLIGMPGDRVQMRDGTLYLNDKAIPKVRVQDYVETGGDGQPHHVPQFRETLPGGKSYLVLDRDPQGALDNTDVFVVPPDHYFMMGDNRDNSDDSRELVGYVPAENLEGKALIRFFSTDGSARVWEIWKWPFAVRYSRLLTLID